MLCVFVYSWNDSGEMFWLMSHVVPRLSSGCGGSIVFGSSSGVIDLLLGFVARSTSVIAYGGVNSMSPGSWICCGS